MLGSDRTPGTTCILESFTGSQWTLTDSQSVSLTSATLAPQSSITTKELKHYSQGQGQAVFSLRRCTRKPEAWLGYTQIPELFLYMHQHLHLSPFRIHTHASCDRILSTGPLDGPALTHHPLWPLTMWQWQVDTTTHVTMWHSDSCANKCNKDWLSKKSFPIRLETKQLNLLGTEVVMWQFQPMRLKQVPLGL
jgi:hypothetical protein